MRLRPYLKWWTVLLALLGLVVLVSCVGLAIDVIIYRVPIGDVAERLTYVNDTDQPLQFYGQYQGEGLFKDELVGPRSSKTATWMITGPTLRIVGERPDGKKVFDRTYTWKELDQTKGQVVVSSLEPIEGDP